VFVIVHVSSRQRIIQEQKKLVRALPSANKVQACSNLQTACILNTFFFFHVQGPKRILRMHCSLVAYCACPISNLTVPTFAVRCLSASYTTRELQAVKGGTMCGRETRPLILPRYADFLVHSRVPLHAVNL
jgi:hypothetical protein